MIFKHTPRPTHSPWDHPDYSAEIAAGIWTVSTPSHGGILVSDERRAAMPPKLRDHQPFAGGNWYEEDCDWCVVALAFPEYFKPDVLKAAQRTYDDWIDPNGRWHTEERARAEVARLRAEAGA